MSSKKEALGDVGLLIMRLGAGVQLAAYYGWDKLTHFSERAPTWFDPFNLGHRRSLQLTVAAEFFAAIALALGLAGRLAGLLVAFGMTVVTFWADKGQPWRQRETAIVYLCIGLAVMLLGPGGLSVDRLVFARLFKKLRARSSAPRGDGPEA